MLNLLILFTAFTLSGHTAVQTISEKETAPIPPPLTQTPSHQHYMLISPSARASDFQQAFELLRKEKTAGKVYFQLADGTTITNVIEMTLMPNSTLVLFRYNSNQGVRLQVVKLEDILNIFY
jgi:hypothetical protein